MQAGEIAKQPIVQPEVPLQLGRVLHATVAKASLKRPLEPYQGQNNSLAKRVRQGPVIPKLEESYSEAGEIFRSLSFQGKVYRVTPFLSEAVQRDHQVWKAEAEGMQFILKTYHHHRSEPSKMHRIIQEDAQGYTFIHKFLTAHSISDVRLAQAYSDPSRDGIFLMEYVQGECVKNKEQLIIVRNLIECMWREKIDVGDFRPDNVLWKDNQLVIVDFSSSAHKSDLRVHLLHYIDEWANGSEEAREYLFQNLQDLKSEPTSEDLDWEV